MSVHREFVPVKTIKVGRVAVGEHLCGIPPMCQCNFPESYDSQTCKYTVIYTIMFPERFPVFELSAINIYYRTIL